jgi:hypothetical protein
MSIMAWLLAIIARESSDGMSPTVSTDCACANTAMGAASTAGAPASSVRLVIFMSVSCGFFESMPRVFSHRGRRSGNPGLHRGGVSASTRGPTFCLCKAFD